MDNTPAHPIILMLLDNSFVSDARVEKEAESLLAIGASLTVGCLIEKGLPEEERFVCGRRRPHGENRSAI